MSIVNHAWRDKMVEKLGEGPWKGLYSLVAAIGLTLLILGYDPARHNSITLYTSPDWLKHFSLLLLLPVFPLLIAAYFPGRIKAAVRHPMLLAVKLWAFAHLLANGTLVNALLFSSFLVWGIADRISINHRPHRSPPSMPATKMNDAFAILGGISLYILFVVKLHEIVIGVPPL